MITRYANVPIEELLREALNSPDELLRELAQRYALDLDQAYRNGYNNAIAELL